MFHQRDIYILHSRNILLGDRESREMLVHNPNSHLVDFRLVFLIKLNSLVSNLITSHPSTKYHIPIMNYFRYHLLLFASMTVAGLSSSDAMLRGSAMTTTTTTPEEQILQDNNGKPNTRNHRRHLIQDMACQLHRKVIFYGPTEYHPSGYSEESWACELPREESSRIGVQFVDIVDVSRILRPSETTLSSGQSSLMLSEAIVDTRSDGPHIYVPENAQVTVQATNNNNQNQHIPQTTGKLKTLMIRIIDSKNAQPEQSIEQLENGVYNDNSSFMNQMKACSYNKLEIQPFSGTTLTGLTIDRGVTDINVDYDVSLGTKNEVDLQNAALAAANDQIGNLNTDDFDLLMFCLPPQPNTNMIAYQLVGTKFTFYDSKWCSSVSVLMHEVGHTLGLDNSNALETDGNIAIHGDKTGMMGAFDDKSSSRCYNVAKSHQLGWYNHQVKSINPLNINRSNNRSIPEFTLNGVSDYGNNPDALVVLKLQQQKKGLQNYFIGYNRANGIHADTSMDENKVMILRAEDENGRYGSSTKVAALRLGQSHTLTDFNGNAGRDIEVRFVGLFEGNAIIQVMDIKKTPSTPIIHTPEDSCSNFKIEVTTDAYPGDTYWTILENGESGRVVAKSQVYDSEDTTTTTTVCLPDRNDNVQYKFQIFDEYGDGLCCDQGNGSYKGFDPSGNQIFEGDEYFEASEHIFDANANVGVDEPAENLILPSILGPCKDKRRKIQWDRKKKKKRSCNWIAKTKKCNVLLDNGEPLWTLCPESCVKCSA
jgi:hypothetical protein